MSFRAISNHDHLEAVSTNMTKTLKFKKINTFINLIFR